MSTTPTAANDLKPPTVAKLFVDRLTREGRAKEWQETLATVQRETGKRFSQAKPEAMRRCGYKGPDHERGLHDAWLMSQKAEQAAEIEQRVEQRVGEVEDSRSFEDALKHLPLSADSAVENEWVLAHPALSRKTRSKNADEPVVITSADLLEANHGRCPSAAAANKLVHWANNPAKVFENLAIVMKKSDGADSARNDGYIEDPGIEEIERLLKAITDDCHEDRVKKAVELLRGDGYIVTPPGEQTTPAA